MKETGNLSENASLRPFACTRGAEQQYRMESLRSHIPFSRIAPGGDRLVAAFDRAGSHRVDVW
jgi:hypothetical protein